jgi:hypothetical protein
MTNRVNNALDVYLRQRLLALGHASVSNVEAMAMSFDATLSLREAQHQLHTILNVPSQHLFLVGGRVRSAIYHARVLLIANRDPVPVADWLADRGLYPGIDAAMEEGFSRHRQQGLFLFRPRKSVLMGRAATALNMYDTESCRRSMIKRGVRGAELFAVYAEYEGADKTIHDPANNYFTDGKTVWSPTVAMGPSPAHAAKYYAAVHALEIVTTLTK